MPKRLKLTKTVVAGIAFTLAGQKDYYDAELPNFGVRVSKASRKYFVMKYVGAKRVRHMIGDASILTAEKARDRAKIVLGTMTEGHDPNEAKRKKARKQKEIETRLTVAGLVKKYLEEHAMVKKKSWQADARCLHKELLNESFDRQAKEWIKQQGIDWSDRPAAEIRKKDIIALLDGIVKRGSPAMAGACLMAVSKMYNFAISLDLLEFNPCFGVKKPAKPNHKDRVLNEAEIRTFWHNLSQGYMGEEVQRALKLILITGTRPGEVIGMHADEIETTLAGEKWWTVPSKRSSKNDSDHRVYLTALALEIIGDKTGYIFESPVASQTNADGTPRPPQPIHVNALAHAVRASLYWPLTDKQGNPLYQKDGTQATLNRIGVDNWTPHDLRRTMATHLAGMGFKDEVIDALLNHAKRGVIGIYNRYRYDAEKKEALQAWEQKLRAIIGAPAMVRKKA